MINEGSCSCGELFGYQLGRIFGLGFMDWIGLEY